MIGNSEHQLIVQFVNAAAHRDGEYDAGKEFVDAWVYDTAIDGSSPLIMVRQRILQYASQTASRPLPRDETLCLLSRIRTDAGRQALHKGSRKRGAD